MLIFQPSSTHTCELRGGPESPGVSLHGDSAPVAATTTTTPPRLTLLTWGRGLSSQSGPDLSGDLAGEAGSQPGGLQGSDDG